MDDETGNNEIKKKPNYGQVTLGVLAFIFFIWGFLGEDVNIILRLFNGIMVAGGGLIISITIFYVGFACYSIFFNSVYRTENSFLGGIKGALAVFLILLFFDGAILGGTFIYGPVTTFLITGSFEDTYWNCEGIWWEHEQGSYCAKE